MLLGAIGFGAQDWRLFVGCWGGTSSSLWNLRGVDSVVVVTVVSSRVRVLIKVHQDVLDLGLLRGMHHHDYRSWISLLPNYICGCCAWHWLMIYELVLSKIVLIINPSTSILSVESLRVWAGPCFLWCGFKVVSSRPSSQETCSTTCWCLPFWASLWLLTLVRLECMLVRIRILCEVGLSRVLLMILIPWVLGLC